MKNTLKAFCILCFLCLDIGIGLSATSDRNALVVSSEPDGAGVFHYLRGEYYFLGYTPLEVTKNDLDGKDDTRILLVKYGYNQSVMDLSLDGRNRLYKLRPISQPYLLCEKGASSKYAKCKTQVSGRIQKIIYQGNRYQIDLQLPASWSENGGKTKLVVLANLLNHDDIVAIRKAERRDKEEAIAHIKSLLSPVTKQLIHEFGQLDCLQYLLLIATYHGKGLKIDFTPYTQYWTATTTSVIGNTKYITTAIGSTIELQQDMVVVNNNKTFLFEYKLH
jgi:uncharacterized protein YcgL (UPF0745 family)